MKFSKDGKFAYLIYELNNTIQVYRYDGSGKNPDFELLQTESTLASHDDETHDATSGLVCHRMTNMFLFNSRRGYGCYV